MKQYLLAVHSAADTPLPSPEEIQKAFADVAVFNTELQASGSWVFGGGLCPPDTATVVRTQSGDVLVTDGPFTEGKEVLGGYYMFNADSYDHAIELTRDHPQLEYGGTVEVREIQDLSQAARNA